MKTNTTAEQDKIELQQRIAKRAACPISGHYPFVLVFEREHTTGALAGIKQYDDLPEVAARDGVAWCEKINAKHAAGRMPYRVRLVGVAAVRS